MELDQPAAIPVDEIETPSSIWPQVNCEVIIIPCYAKILF